MLACCMSRCDTGLGPALLQVLGTPARPTSCCSYVSPVLVALLFAFRIFLNETNFQPASAYYSVDLPGIAHVVSLNNYVSWSGQQPAVAEQPKDLLRRRLCD
jgi:hypothetical protein